MEKNIIVLGIGRFGYAAATRLFERGMYVTAVDTNYDTIERIADSVSTAIQADITEEVAMKSLGISNYDVAIIATGSDLEASIEATLICKDSGVERVIAKASSKAHARILKKIGADQIVFPEIDTAESLSRSLAGSSVIEHIQLSDDVSIIEVKAEKEWIGKSLVDLDFRQRYEMNVIAFKRDGQILIDYDPNILIRERDVLILLGAKEKTNSFN